MQTMGANNWSTGLVQQVLPHRLAAQQAQQGQAAQQMQSDDSRKQFHGHCQRTKCPLHTNPQQGEAGPPGAHPLAQHRRSTGPLSLPMHTPGIGGQHQNQHPHSRGQVAVDHLNPGLAMGDRTAGHGVLSGSDRSPGTCWRAHAVATRPIRAAQARVCQAGECAEQHQVKGQEQSQQGQGILDLSQAARPIAPPHPHQGSERQQQAYRHKPQQGR